MNTIICLRISVKYILGFTVLQVICIIFEYQGEGVTINFLLKKDQIDNYKREPVKSFKLDGVLILIVQDFTDSMLQKLPCSLQPIFEFDGFLLWISAMANYG